MVECATLLAGSSKLDFSLGPALPITKLSFAEDFGLPAVTTPVDERKSMDWSTPCDDDNTPVPRRAGARSTVGDVPPPMRLRLAESHPALNQTPVPGSWRRPIQLHNDLLDVPANDSFGAAGSPRRLDARTVRRTQSMFPSPQQFMTAELGGANLGPLPTAPAGLGAVPTFTAQEDNFPRISANTLVRILDGEFAKQFDNTLIIDCRFEYEYKGGHIEGAKNISCKQKLESLVPMDTNHGDRTLIVFHCEYSAYRGPLMATHLRQCDRNANSYPKLTYPNIAVLDGGYSGFYSAKRERCEPQNYVGMNDTFHKSTCEREMERFRTGMRLNAKKLGRPSASFSHLPSKSLDLGLGHSNMSTPSLQRGFTERHPLETLNF